MKKRIVRYRAATMINGEYRFLTLTRFRTKTAAKRFVKKFGRGRVLEESRAKK